MRASVVRIGNSRGIRIPKPVLEQCHIADEVELTVARRCIVLRPVPPKAKQPRAGWTEALARMAQAGDDTLLLDAALDAPVKDWRW